MTDSRWQKIEAVFSLAVELPEEKWEDVLSAECGDDEELREEVLQLLRQVDPSEDYLLDLAKRVGIPTAGLSTEGLAGRKVGRYRLLRLLGRGGMGSVYLAEREEEGFKLTAAVKVVATGLLSEAARQRFLAERRILAGLQHPNIARLFDGGVTEDGTPYLVMEHVPGVPIDQFCDDLSLSLDDRVRLFLRVCDAVEHAHQRLVVHRDLKPTNVLVTESGEVKLLDFGIARALDADESHQLTATFLPHPMTVAWASPEQIQGLPVSTTTDVYGLGLLLYRLIAGRHPYEVPRESLAKAERIICETDPLPPHKVLNGVTDGGGADPGSAARSEEQAAFARQRSTSLPRLRRQLAGDLGHIILKALRKEPDRRYRSVGDMAGDLRRYLRQMPVTARPDSASYRLKRFVARHRTSVAAGGLLTLMALALVGMGIRSALTIRNQADRIADEAETTLEVTNFLLEILALADPTEGSGDTLTVRAALERGIAHHRDHLTDRPELRARLLEVMADAYSGLGMEIEATALLQEALALRPETGEVQDTVVAELLMKLATAYFTRGRFSDALSLNQQAERILADVGGDSVQLARALGAQALDLQSLDQLDTALALGDRSLEILLRHAGETDIRTLWQMSRYATSLRAAQLPDSAEMLQRHILDHIDPTDEEHGQLAALTLNNLGFLLRSREDYPGAASHYRRALDEVGRWMGPSQRITTMANLAAALEYQGDLAGTEAILTERLEFARHAWPAGSWRLGQSAMALGGMYVRQDRFADAEPFLREAVESYSDILGPNHRWTANAESILGANLGYLDKLVEGEGLLIRGHRTLLEQAGAEDRWTVDAVNRLVTFYEMSGREAEAERYRVLLPPRS